MKPIAVLPGLVGVVAVCLSSIGPARAAEPGADGFGLVCPLELHERARDLADATIEKALAENQDRTQVRVFEMIEKLWNARSVEQEVYLDYKRRRDRTRVRVRRLALEITQHERALAQYELACAYAGGEGGDDVAARVAALQAEVRRLECDLLAKDTEIGDIDRAFDEAVFAATKILVERSIKTRYDLVLDEYDLAQSKARSESDRRRTRACRQRLEDEGL